MGGGGGAGADTAGTNSEDGGAGASGKVILTEYGMSGATVVASPTGVPADGTTQSTITVTLSTPCGVMAGKTVALRSTRGATDTITTVTNPTDASGQAKFAVKSSTCGTANMIATVDGSDLAQQPTLSFSATSGATAGASTFTTSVSSQLADGASTAVLTAILKTAGNCPVTGQQISVTSNRAAADSPNPVGTQITDNTGQATFTVTSNDWTTSAGLSTYTAQDLTAPAFTLTPKPTVQWNIPISGLRFLPGPSDTGVALPFLPVVRVAAYNMAGAPWSGGPLTVTLSITGGAGALVNGPKQNSNTPTPPTADTVGGIAAFPGTAVSAKGIYTMTATCSSCGLPAITVVSQPFIVSQTSAPWPTFHQNMLRDALATGGKADMATTHTLTELADYTGGTSGISSTPLLVDLNGDGMLDLVTVNDFRHGAGGSLAVNAFFQAAGAFPALPSWSYSVPTDLNLVVNNQPATDAVATLAAGDLNGDGSNEVVVFSNNFQQSINSAERIRALNGQTGALLASSPLDTTHWECLAPSAPAIGDINADGIADIVVVREDGGCALSYVSAFRLNGAALTIEFETTMDPANGASASPVLGEFRPNHAGLEIMVGTNPGDTQSTVLLCKPTPTGIGNLPTNGVCDESVATGTAANGDGVVGLAAGDLNGDGYLEAVSTGGALAQAQLGKPNSLAAYTITPALSLLSSTLTNEPLDNTPALGDIDGDKQLDIGLVDFNAACCPASVATQAGNANYYHLNGAGTTLVQMGATLARTTTPPKQSQGGGALADLTNDGKPEYIFGSADSTIVATSATPSPVSQSWTVTTASNPVSPPSVGDVTGDCRPEVAIGESGGQVAFITGIAAQAPSASPEFDASGGGTNYLVVANWPGADAHTFTSPGDAPTPARQAKLAWNAIPAGTDGGLQVVMYYVFRAPGAINGGGPTGAFAYVGKWPSSIPPTPTNPFIDATMAAGGDYYYKIGAVTCFTMANSANGAGPLSVNWFYSEVKVPKAPTLLTGNPGTAPTRVDLFWIQPATTPGAVDHPNGCGLYTSPTPPYVLTYNIYRRTPSTGAAPIPGPPYKTGLTATSYSDLGVTNGGSYDYEVTAINCVGESPHSTLITVVVGNPPATPTGLKVQPYGAPAYSGSDPAGPCTPPAGATCKSVKLDWNAVTTAGSDCASISGYKIYRSLFGAGTYALVGTVAVGTTTYMDAAVPMDASPAFGASYDYTVTSYCTNPVALESGKQVTPARADVLRPLTPAAPVANAIGATTMRVSWTDPGSNNVNCPTWEEGYYLFKRTNAGAMGILETIKPVTNVAGAATNWRLISNPATAPGTAAPLFYDDTLVSAGNTYVYQVEAINCVGQSFLSPVSVAAPFGLTAKPYGNPAYATALPKKVQLDWTAVGVASAGGCSAGIQGYKVYRGAVAGPYTFLWDTGAATTYTDTTVAVGSSYGYNIHGYCNTPTPQESGDGFPVTADVLLPNTPAAPTVTVNPGPVMHVAWVDPGSNNVNCAWEEGYRIYRQDNGAGGFNAIGLVTGTPQSWTMAVPRAIVGWGSPTTAAPLAFDDNTVTAGNTYEYKVSAVNCVGESLLSPVAIVSGGNTPPSFQDLSDPAPFVSPAVDTPVTKTAWAFTISPSTPAGTASESGQKLKFTTTFVSGSAAIFTIAPSVAVTTMTAGPFTASPWGDMTYTVAANQCGTAQYKVTATDDGTLSPPPDGTPMTSLDHFVNIVISCPNMPPTFQDLLAPATTTQSPISSTVGPISGWAYTISPGAPAAEANQNLYFSTSFVSGSATMLTGLPVVTRDIVACPSGCAAPFTSANGWGDLTYTVAANECGTATYRVNAWDDGTMTPGPNQAPKGSIDHALVITVKCVNAAPNFAPGATLPTVLEDSAPATITAWASAITAGTAGEDATQKLQFSTTVLSNPGLFATPPTLTPATPTAGPFNGAGMGDLTYTLAKDGCGSATFQITLKDDGSNIAPAANSVTKGPFTLQVTCVNDPPVFKAADDMVKPTVGHRVFTNWATALAPARATATDEQWGVATQQHMVFTTTYTILSGQFSFTDDPSVSNAPAACAPSAFCNGLYDSSGGWGTLSYGVTPGATGVAALTVCLQDDGGTANGGLDKTCAAFKITSQRDVASGADTDSDGIIDASDNCPGLANHDQADTDHNGIGDVCEPKSDTTAKPDDYVLINVPTNETPADIDLDGIADSADNCPTIPNRDQADLDRDGVGDACDSDTDGDGVPNVGPSGTQLDNCPSKPNADQLDQNHDGIGDACLPANAATPGTTSGTSTGIDGYSTPSDSSPLAGGNRPAANQPLGVSAGLLAGWLAAAGAIAFGVIRLRRKP